MQEKDLFCQFLEQFSRDSIINAIDLRSASAEIIKKWINFNFEYPNEQIDRLIYIESSIEESIFNNLNDAIALKNECSDAYDFHIRNFLDVVESLRIMMKSGKAV